jgi:hypothetical protein
VFYGFIKAITEAVYRWFHFSSTASVWLNKRVFTRLVYQPPVYAFGAPTTCLRVRCTNHLLMKHWLIRGDASVYRLRSLLQYKGQPFIIQQEHTIPYVFRAPGYGSLVPLNWYKQVLKNIINYPPPNCLLLLIGYIYNAEKPLNILINYSIIYFKWNLIVL